MSSTRRAPGAYRRRKRSVPGIALLVLLLAILAIPVLAISLPTSIVTDFLTVRDALLPADAIYVLGGDFETRAPAAAALFRNGVAPLIVLARERSSLGGSPRPADNFTEVTKRMLLAAGVPRKAILELTPEPPVDSTSDEAHALRKYADAKAPASVIVLTSAIHSRRARMMMSRILAGRNTDVRVWPVQPAQPADSAEVRKEITKYLYYSLTFW